MPRETRMTYATQRATKVTTTKKLKNQSTQRVTTANKGEGKSKGRMMVRNINNAIVNEQLWWLYTVETASKVNAKQDGKSETNEKSSESGAKSDGNNEDEEEWSSSWEEDEGG